MNTKQVSTECPECEIGSLTRNNYFTGKLLVERDFKDEQRYYIDKLRLHQKRLHGEGVVCGLEVKQHQSEACRARYVCIQPGFAKDCCGNDIVVPTEECIDLTRFKNWTALQAAQNKLASGRGPAGGPGLTAAHTLQICICYRECPTENIPVLYDDCGCDETACAPNRILESYEFSLLVDPEIKINNGCLPSLGAAAALNGVSASALAYDPNDTYLYALDNSVPATLYQMDPAGQTTIASFKLSGAGKAVAVSDDGKLVYAVSYDSVATQSSLVVLNATGLVLAGTSAALADDATSASLAALSTTQVAWLQTTGPQFMVWDASTAVPTQTKTVVLTGSPMGLALGADRSKAYYIDSANNQIGVVDVSAGATLPPLTLVANPSQVLLASSTGPDTLAVIDGTNATITAVQANPARLIASIALMNQPLAAVADPQKKVLYLVTDQPGSPATYQLQTFDLQKLVTGLPQLPAPGTPSIQPAGPTGVVTDGHHVFVVAGAQISPNDAGFQINSQPCPDLYELEECHDCCVADCLVLATIRGYQPGFMIKGPETPPTDPVTDYGNQIARIDNKLGRKILPSTSKIAEVVESLLCGCACACGEQTVTVTAPPQQPVTGLNFGLPKIIDIGWQHGGSVTWARFLTNKFLKVPAKIGDPPYPLLTIYFNQVMTGVDRQSFRVDMKYPSVTQDPAGAVVFSGFYEQLSLYGVLVDLVPLGANITPNTREVPKSAWAFIPYPELWNRFANFRDPWLGAFYKNPRWPPLDLPCVRITLSGDFVYAGPPYAESGILDGENIGGQVGLNQMRGGPMTGGKNPSGDGVEGGIFESWFYLEAANR